MPTTETVRIGDPQTGSSARISVTCGFNCFEFTARQGQQELHVLASDPEFEHGSCPPSHSGIPILFPYPNRIRSGRFFWDGQEYRLPESQVAFDGAGNAIHGLCLDRPWRVTNQSESSVTGVFRISTDAPDRASLWPADAELTVRYEIRGTCLHSRLTVHNPSERPLPWGIGTHTYFRLPLAKEWPADNVKIFAPVQQLRELVDCLPTGNITDLPPRSDLSQSPEYGRLKLDTAYHGLRPDEDGSVTTRLSDPVSGRSVTQRFSGDFQELVAFTPPWTTAVCLEPYTCCTDAINLQQQGHDTGLRVMSPGDSWQGFVDIDVRF